MNKFYFHFNNWIASWFDIICGVISVVTFTLYRPWWDFSFRAWATKKELNMKRSNAKLKRWADTGEPVSAQCMCKCGMQWEPDMDQFGCWSCGAEKPSA